LFSSRSNNFSSRSNLFNRCSVKKKQITCNKCPFLKGKAASVEQGSIFKGQGSINDNNYQIIRDNDNYQVNIDFRVFLEKLSDDANIEQDQHIVKEFIDTLICDSSHSLVFEAQPMIYSTSRFIPFDYHLTTDECNVKAEPDKFFKQFSNYVSHATEFKATEFNNAKLNSTENVAVFENNQKDAIMISPRPPSDTQDNYIYGNISTFVEKHTYEIVREYFRVVAKTLLELMKENPNEEFYMSTHGTTVPWFHMRLENSDWCYKYYNQ